MCRVEKSTWYIFEKERGSRDTPSCVSCKYSEIVNLKFQYQATRNFSCVLNVFINDYKIHSVVLTIVLFPKENKGGESGMTLLVHYHINYKIL